MFDILDKLRTDLTDQRFFLKTSGIISIILFVTVMNGNACRYTIRDIGFSPLDLEYFVLVLETDTANNQKLVKEFSNLAYAYSIDANIRYKVFPTMKKNTVLYCYDKDNRIIDQEQIRSFADLQRFMKNFLFSPLRRQMAEQMGQTFAFVIYFAESKNLHDENEIDKALRQFVKISPGLDKEITERVRKIVVPRDGWQKEKVVLRSLGLSPEARESAVAILYGRARMLAEPLAGKEITRENILRQLVILGTDCECGMDLRPLIKEAIPFNWDSHIRQEVSDMLGFDVDNPMILSEMAGILSKESEEITGQPSFVPQTFDLDREFGPVSRDETANFDEAPERAVYFYPVVIVTVMLILMVAGTVVFLYLRKNR